MVAHHDRKFKLKILIHSLLGVLILFTCAFLSLFIFESKLNDVSIDFNGHVYAGRTLNTTVKDFIETNNIPFDESNDYINVSPIDSLDENTTQIAIITAVPVDIVVDGTSKTVMTYKETVGEVLKDENVSLYENDILIDFDFESKVYDSMKLEIVRITKGIVVETSPLQNYVEIVENEDLAINEHRIAVRGSFGENTKVFEITYENGVETARICTLEAVTIEPINQVVEYGVIPVKIDANTGESFQYLNSEIFVATAYTLAPEECGGKEPGDPGYGITFSGMPAAVGVIAVDPTVIPIGTKVYIETLSGDFLDYGMSIAGDTGSGIKGFRIDLYMVEKQDALNWGRREVRVYFIYGN